MSSLFRSQQWFLQSQSTFWEFRIQIWSFGPNCQLHEGNTKIHTFSNFSTIWWSVQHANICCSVCHLSFFLLLYDHFLSHISAHNTQIFIEKVYFNSEGDFCNSEDNSQRKTHGNEIIVSWAILTVIKHMLPPSNAMGNAFQSQHIYCQGYVCTNTVI